MKSSHPFFTRLIRETLSADFILNELKPITKKNNRNYYKAIRDYFKHKGVKPRAKDIDDFVLHDMSVWLKEKDLGNFYVARCVNTCKRAMTLAKKST